MLPLGFWLLDPLHGQTVQKRKLSKITQSRPQGAPTDAAWTASGLGLTSGPPSALGLGLGLGLSRLEQYNDASPMGSGC